jgi:hypothetical protein
MNRLSLASAAFGLAVALSGPIRAPVPAPAPAPAAAPTLAPSHVEAAREVVELTGLSATIDSIFPQFRAQTQQLVGATRPEMIKDSEAVIAFLKPESDKKRDEMATSAAVIFAQKMSEADLKEVAGFFKSPVGQRYSLLRNQALDEIYAILEPWSRQTSNMLFDRFSEEMRKRGHKL